MIEFQIVVTVRQHEGLITDICEVENPMYVVTSSMDGNIKYYSVQLKRSLEMEHTADQTASAINAKFKKGVLGIDHGK